MRTQLAALAVLCLLSAPAAAQQPGGEGEPTDKPADKAPDKPADKAPDKPAGGDTGSEGEAAKPAPPHGAHDPHRKRTFNLPPGHPPLRRHEPQEKQGLPPVPLAPPAIFPSQLEGDDDEEIVGIHQGRVFIRDPHDRFRIYPGVRLRLDYSSALGGPELPPAVAGNALGARLAVRRVRFDTSGQLFHRLYFTAGIELGGGRIGDTVYAGPNTSRFSMPSAHDGKVRPAEVTISYRFRPWLGFTLGQQNVPFSMSNRTREEWTPLMERVLAIRGLVVPYEKDLGLVLWGDVMRRRMIGYEIGIFNGDGADRPGADDHPDVIGRVFARPLARLGRGTFQQQAQIGVSARYGARDPDGLVTYDYPTLASAQGFVLWQPGYVDSLDRVTHVIPSGAQRAIGGELRLPFALPGGRGLDVRGEAYYLVNDTREAVEGFLGTNTERLGRVKGVGWYAMVSFWACCSAFASGEPGDYRPVSVDLKKSDEPRRGLEIIGVASGVVANYSGATREGSTPDPNTPDSNIALYQLGGAVQYWHGRHFRAAVDYLAYLAPDSGDARKNQAIVPDNLAVDATGAKGGGHVHHELGMRMAVTF